MESRPRVSLVVPTYNESQNIVALLEKAHQALLPYAHEILVIDDNSPDQTAQLVLDYAKEHSWVRLEKRFRERGLSRAVLRGFDLARGDVLAVMDADLSHDETILPNLIKAVEGPFDLAVGSRRIPGGGATKWPWYRRWTSDIATRLAQTVLRIQLSDPMTGFFSLKRSLYDAVKKDLEPSGYKILLEIYYKSPTCRTLEIPFVFRDRTQGYSKLSGLVMYQYLRMLFRLRASRFHANQEKRIEGNAIERAGYRKGGMEAK